MNNFTRNYEKILQILQQVEGKMNFMNQKCKPKLSDIELIAVDLTSEYMSIDSVYQLFITLSPELLTKIERSVYNRRKRKLFCYRESLRKKLAGQISDNNHYIVDSMPLEVCQICKEDWCSSPNKG